MQIPIFKTVVMTDSERGFLLICDTILWDDKYWIVPLWLEHKATGKRQPERIILLDNLPHQTSDPKTGHHFFLNGSIPKDVFSGHVPKETIYRVIMLPEIYVDSLPPTTH